MSSLKGSVPLTREMFDYPIYENSRYIVVVGSPEYTRERPEARDEYLIYNKETGVQEYSHTVLVIAKDWADSFAKVMDEPPKKDEAPVQGGLFN